MSDQAVQIVWATPGPLCPLAARQHTVLLCAVPTPISLPTEHRHRLGNGTLQGSSCLQIMDRSLFLRPRIFLWEGRVGVRRREKRDLVCGRSEKSCRTYGWHSQQLWEAMGQTCLRLSGTQGSGGPCPLSHQRSQDAVGRILWVGAVQNPHPRLCHTRSPL